ncbi:hypothetical protein HYW53_01145 [Candidatus Giovannonibacteria bacterium]|nr:hypothetical protein [Candidatus Giovannonibacteria bacterium]
MALAFIFLMIFFAAYFIFAGAIIYHLKIYAFSRSANWMVNLFLVVSALLAVLAIIVFWKINWPELWTLYVKP